MERREKISRKFLAFHFSYLWVVEILERFFFFSHRALTRDAAAAGAADVDDDGTQAAQVYVRLVSFSINHLNGFFAFRAILCFFCAIFSSFPLTPHSLSLAVHFEWWTHFSHIIARFLCAGAEESWRIVKVNLRSTWVFELCSMRIGAPKDFEF